MILTTGGRAVHEHARLVRDQIENLKEVLAAGTVSDWTQYKSICGRIAGLRESLDIMNEAIKIADKQ